MTLDDIGGGAATNRDKTDPNKVNVFIDPTKDFNSNEFGSSPKVKGQEMKNPIWVVVMHEFRGHAVFKYLTNNGNGVGPNERGMAVDYENELRKLNGLNEKAYDLYHPEPN